MLIPHGALVLVLDHDHVRLLRNRGRETQPDLEPVPEDILRGVERHQGRSDVGRRMRDILRAVEPLLAGGTPLLLVAPAQLLGTLRESLPCSYGAQIIAEIPKDLVGCPARELTQRLHLARA